MEYNVLNIENQNLIVKKAKTKTNGVYTIRGIVYRVKNFSVTHFCAKGEILQAFGCFNCIVGKYEHSFNGEINAKKILKELKD
jgi:hypothetical protein